VRTGARREVTEHFFKACARTRDRPSDPTRSSMWCLVPSEVVLTNARRRKNRAAKHIRDKSERKHFPSFRALSDPRIVNNFARTTQAYAIVLPEP
jgi:hypothetical protein